MPYAPVKVSVHGSWSADASTLMISSLDQHLSSLSYPRPARKCCPPAEELDAAGPPLFQVCAVRTFPAPADSPPRWPGWITKHASTLRGKAMAIQDWFTKMHEFTLQHRRQPAEHADACCAS